MLVEFCRQDFSKRHIGAILTGLLATVVLSFWFPNPAAQTCAVVTKGQNRGKCANPGATCKSGDLHGVCTKSGVKGEYECDCKTVAPPPPTCATLNVCPAGAPLANNLFYIHDLGGRRRDA